MEDIARTLMVIRMTYERRYKAIAPARWDDPRIPVAWQAALEDAAVMLKRPLTDREISRAVTSIPLTR